MIEIPFSGSLHTQGNVLQCLAVRLGRVKSCIWAQKANMSRTGFFSPLLSTTQAAWLSASTPSHCICHGPRWVSAIQGTSSFKSNSEDSFLAACTDEWGFSLPETLTSRWLYICESTESLPKPAGMERAWAGIQPTHTWETKMVEDWILRRKSGFCRTEKWPVTEGKTNYKCPAYCIDIMT